MSGYQALNLEYNFKPVLIVEDRKENQVLLRNLCKSLGLETFIADNGQVALDICENQDFSLYIVDLMMPVMDGRTFIENLKKVKDDPMVLVQTALDASETIVDVMKLGVLDYVIKPLEKESFLYILKKSMEHIALKDERNFENLNSDLRLRSQLDWIVYKTNLLKNDQDQSIFEKLRTTLTQGGGFGSMVSMIDMLKMSVQEHGEDELIINREIAEVLFENNKKCKTMMSSLAEISRVMDSSLELENVEVSELIQIFTRLQTELGDYLRQRNIYLVMPEFKKKVILSVDKEHLYFVFQELLLNALKASRTDSKIQIWLQEHQGYLSIYVKNQPKADQFGGVPRRYEKMVLEPFFQIRPTEEEFSDVEKFSMGLGLTYVSYIARQHNGMFNIHDIQDHSATKGSDWVLACFSFPVNRE